MSDLKIADQYTHIDKNAFVSLQNTLTNISLININVSRTWNLDFLRDLHIKYLSLNRNGNYPEHLPDAMFRNLNLTELRFLSMQDCGIVEIMDDSFAGLVSLETLDLSHNNIPQIGKWIQVLTNLKTVNLSHNGRLIYVGDNAFYTLHKLETLDLSHTGINAILESAFVGLENSLKVLSIHHAQLQHGHFSTMRILRKLQSLDISYNKIVEMHNTSFIGFASLQELDISGQRDRQGREVVSLNFIDSVFRGLEQTLKVLNLRDLMLTSVPLAALSPLINLEVIELSDNDFTEIYEDFFYGVHASTIYMKHMKVNEVSSDAFRTNTRGLHVVFDDNDIANLSFILDTDRCKFRRISFLDNPVQCDCDVLEIVSTKRVSEIIGACHDGIFRGEELSTLHKLPVTKTICDTQSFENVTTNCVYATRSCALYISIDLRLYLWVILSCFSVSYFVYI
ncbi:hypothetical protein DPMN_047933 [Dreissena polymorpha]|uniref:Uncharacterized protein n=1 Tax=Dreissena polymorpha TaxID=45954 RepID=A0A9D4DCC7_DREPO|nr:hypothetical protein DPMN_047933 [Dreissena polymorpha]